MIDHEQAPVFLWFDSEFTSLELETAHLLQVAMLATDGGLRRTTPAEADINVFVRLPDSVEVSAWTRQHIPQIIAGARSEAAVAVDEVDRLLCAFVHRRIGPTPADVRQRPILAGNSIHADLGLIRKQLPRFAACLHYRMLDVSAIKIMWQNTFNGPPFDKEDARLVEQYLPFPFPRDAHVLHDAYFDIFASLAEYAYYRAHLHPLEKS